VKEEIAAVAKEVGLQDVSDDDIVEEFVEISFFAINK
jgi:hypothetical protein